MAVDVIERFVSKYETLSGRVHIADGMASAAEAVLSVVVESGGTRLAAAELPEALVQALERRCDDAGVEFLKPPYDGTTLPGAIDAAHVVCPGRNLPWRKQVHSWNSQQTTPPASYPRCRGFTWESFGPHRSRRR